MAGTVQVRHDYRRSWRRVPDTREAQQVIIFLLWLYGFATISYCGNGLKCRGESNSHHQVRACVVSVKSRTSFESTVQFCHMNRERTSYEISTHFNSCSLLVCMLGRHSRRVNYLQSESVEERDSSELLYGTTFHVDRKKWEVALQHLFSDILLLSVSHRAPRTRIPSPSCVVSWLLPVQTRKQLNPGLEGRFEWQHSAEKPCVLYPSLLVTLGYCTVL